MMRIPSADKLNAISSSKFLILEIRTPSAGVISYNVMVGPTLALMELISIPKLRKNLDDAVFVGVLLFHVNIRTIIFIFI